MAKWSGVIGYANPVAEIRPGVWDFLIVERHHVGDLVRNTRRSEGNERIVENLLLNNSISLVADPYARDNFFNMRYAMIFGTRWTIDTVEVQYPRLILQVGGVYNGPTNTPT